MLKLMRRLRNCAHYAGLGIGPRCATLGKAIDGIAFVITGDPEYYRA
jgi:hypothetical protein